MDVKDIANQICSFIDGFDLKMRAELSTWAETPPSGKNIMQSVSGLLSEGVGLNALCVVATLIAASAFSSAFSSKENAKCIVISALNTINVRSSERGEKNERSALKAAEYFNLQSDIKMTENDAWVFMICLKLARSDNSKVHIEDDYIDAVGYVLLLAESVTKNKELHES